MTPSNKQQYPLLKSFKQEIELEKNSPENRPYTFLKPSILFYRIIFLTIGVIYFILALILLSKSLNWTCSLIFGSSLAVKTTLLMICGGVSLISLYFGLFISTERESVKLTIRHAKKKLKKLYSHQFGLFSSKRFLDTDEQNEKGGHIYQHLHKVMEKLDRLQVECIHLVDRISKSESMGEEQKEELFNQAIIELRFKLERMIDTFEQKLLPI